MRPDPAAHARSFQSMGVEVVVGGATDVELRAIATLFDAWDRRFSRFRPDSELARVNRCPVETIVVSPVFARAVRAALAAAAATDGLVDPTLGVAIEAAGYDRDFDELGDDPRLPGPRAPGTWTSVRLVERLLSRPPGTQLDLNGVVKSMAADAAVLVLAGDGFVAAGGDLASRGETAVELPDGPGIRLLAGGMATSGPRRRRWLRGRTAQHHLLDPRTGRPSASRWSEVTVAARTCLAADVAAKAAFLLSDDGPAWLDERGLPGRFLAEGEVVETSAWQVAISTVPEPLGAVA
jgi:FAD:protein FMN transferase